MELTGNDGLGGPNGVVGVNPEGATAGGGSMGLGAASQQVVGEKKRGGKAKLIVLIAGLVVILGGGGLATWLILGQDKSVGRSETSSNGVLWSAEDFPKIDASTATQPLALAFYEDFTGDKNVDFGKFDFTKTHEAYVKLIEKKVDLILVTSPSEDELALAAEKGMELEVVPVVKEGFVFFVSKDNPVDNLTSQQVQDIYAGKIKNWKEVGGEDKPIVAYQRPENSGSQTGMLDLVMKGVPMMTPPSESWAISSMSGIIDAVSSYTNANDALGYSYYYYAVTMYEDIDKDVADGVKLLSIDGVKPGDETIRNESYPFRTAYYIVIDKAAEEESPARKLMKEMLSNRGQAVAREAKYVSVER